MDPELIAGIAGGLENAVTNLNAIQSTREQLRREDETFKADKKIKELELKKAEYLLSPDQLQAERDKIKAETDAKKAALNLAVTQNKNAESKERRQIDEHQKAMDLVDQILNEGANNLPYGVRVKAGNVSVSGVKPGSEGIDESILSLIDNTNDNDKWWLK